MLSIIVPVRNESNIINEVFDYFLNNLKDIRIKSFADFKNLIKKSLFYKNKKKFNKDKYCLKSDKVSNRVFNYYKKIK